MARVPILQRTVVLSTGLAVLAVGAIIAGLTVVESHREAELEALRAHDPAAFLDTVRQTGSAADYLTQLRRLRHFAAWNPHAPLFLIGPWAVEPSREAARRHALEDHCAAGLVFEDGHLRRFGPGAYEAAARYRITEAGRIEVEQAGHTLVLMPRNDGSRIDRLILTADAQDPVYLTRCR